MTLSMVSDSSNSAANTDMFPKKIEIRCWLAATVLAVGIGLVYLPAIRVPFVFDDSATVVENASITKLWPLIGTAENPGPLNASPGTPTAGRPLVNLSLAINYHFGGLNPVGYHVFSIAIHFLTSLLLYAILCRTLVLPYFAGRFAAVARWLALAVAILWALHPLQTEAVIYATQRSELLMAFFYLATLYCGLRYWSALSPPLPLPLGEGRGEGALERDSQLQHSTVWLTLATIACLCGMASKEVMVSAPLMVLLFERTFVAGSLAAALRRSWPLYVGLAATWLLLLFLRLGLPHSEAAGFGLGVPAISYWLTQSKIFLMYLKLAVWPWPLLIHYQLPYLNTFSAAWMYVLPVLLLGIVTLVLLWRNHPLGYLGTWVFAILSPTSIIPIIIEMAAERRMYLPLASLVALFVIGAYLLFQHMSSRPVAVMYQRLEVRSPIAAVMTAFVLFLVLACALRSAERLAEYESKLGLWEQVLRFQPQNPVAHVSIGHELEEAGEFSAAAEHYRQAIRTAADPALAHFELGVALLKQGTHAEAVTEFEKAARLQPDNSLIRNNLAAALYMAGRYREAVAACRAALDLQPKSWWCHNHLGMALKNVGDYSEAIASFERAVELKPDELGIYIDLADCYGRANRPQKKIATLEACACRRRWQGRCRQREKLRYPLKGGPPAR